MIHITRNGIQTATPAEMAEAREAFQRDGCLQLSSLIEPALVGGLVDAIDLSEFYDREHTGIGRELCLSSGTVTTALELLTNDQTLLDAMADLTGCGPFGCFIGRVYRLVPGPEHYDSWHNDVGRDRLVGMSMNLGREPFQGGALQIHRVDNQEKIHEIRIPRPGDAILFRIDVAFRHRVEPLSGTVPRTAYAGWFCASPSFKTMFDERHAEPAVSA